MTSLFRVAVPERFKLATRPNGVEARNFVLQTLKDYDSIELDFMGAHLSPSFADECVGILCQILGWEAFKTRIRLANVSDDSKSLIRHVVGRRRAQLDATPASH
ncbi:hypothetical protein PAP18089_01630 [Pandoraea apista]|uniref:Uncharacterized protein n=2 Tax=Pandoraea apista TaxID=93218 RepID=A0A5E5P1U1_9BURK|nr:hypothetical protein B7H01_20040 [Pandoraea apista]VVG70666.1 hypothetical protein PAP18089_01630 [Pandoraea apista]